MISCVRSIAVLFVAALSIDVMACGAEFARLPTFFPVTTMAVSEDGLRFVTAHEQDNQVSIWDVRTCKLILSFDCPAPRYAIWRGKKLYVANYGRGTVSVYDEDRNWDLTDELPVGIDNVYYLSAPQGKHFRGHLLALGMREDKSRRNAYSKYHYAVLLDTLKRTHHEFPGNSHDLSAATVDYEGKYFFRQGTTNSTGSGKITQYYDFAPFVKNPPVLSNPEKPTREDNLVDMPGLGQGGHGATPILYQVAPGPYWFGSNRLYQGMPPRPDGNEQGLMVIPDMTQTGVVYVLLPSAVKCMVLNPALTDIAQQPVTYPSLQEFPRMQIYGNSYYREFRDEVFFQPFAATHGNAVHLFAPDRDTQTIFRCRLDAFQVPAALAAGERPRMPAETTTFRKWTDATGRFSVEAECVRIENEQVVLIDREGQTVRINLEQLSAADRSHLSSRQKGSK